MPTQSITSLEAQIATLTADITAFNNQLAAKQIQIDAQQAKLPGLKGKWEMANARYLYVKAKAQKAGKKKKDWQCYDNQYLFPSSGACYDRDHWNIQWNHFAAETSKTLKAYNDQKAVVNALLSERNNIRGMRDDKVVERNTAIVAKNALVKSESDANLAAATAVAIKDPEIVKVTLENEKAIKDASLDSNRKLLITALAIGAFVLVALVALRRFA